MTFFDGILSIAIVGGAGLIMYSCTPSDYVKQAEVDRAKKAEADKVPRIVSRSDDGCSVYAFNPGDRWRYFTRCGAQTTTDNDYTTTRQSGKITTTEQHTDSITTEIKK